VKKEASRPTLAADNVSKYNPKADAIPLNEININPGIKPTFDIAKG
jgi:hypothetical protein